MPGAAPLTVRLQDLTVDVSLTSSARGDLLVRGASKWQNLAPGTSGYFLKSQGAGSDLAWSAVSASPAGSTKQVQFNSSGSFGGTAGFEYQSGASPNVLIAAQGSTHVPLCVKGAASQSAAWLQLQDSTGQIGLAVSLNDTGNFQDVYFDIPTATVGEYHFRRLGATQIRIDPDGNLVLKDGSTLTTPSLSTGALTVAPADGNANSSNAHLNLYGGNGWSVTNYDGGSVRVCGGAKAGSGTDGVVQLGYSGSTARGNLALFGAGSFGGGVLVAFVANASTVPTSNPTGGGILYCEGGALKYRGSSGTITTLGAA